MKNILKQARKLSEPFRVTDGKDFRLKKVDPADTLHLDSDAKPRAQQADAAGKDGAIKHVMSGINPQGCEVSSFKAPSAEELDHDFLWRCMRRLPERGRIGIFNRSYYEETL